jgi:hypothetical protein
MQCFFATTEGLATYTSFVVVEIRHDGALQVLKRHFMQYLQSGSKTIQNLGIQCRLDNP